MSHVFISYSKKDKDYTLRLVNKLRDEGFDVWIDDRKLKSSEDWWNSIVLAIWHCDAFVVVLSPESDDSRWVQREITIADKQNKPIFPLLLEGDLDTPNWSLFVRTQYYDVRDCDIPNEDFFDNLAGYAPRGQRRGKNVTVTDKLRTVELSKVDPAFHAEVNNPPPLSEAEALPARRFGRLLYVVLPVIVIALALLAVSMFTNPAPATPTAVPTAASPAAPTETAPDSPTVISTEPITLDAFAAWRRAHSYPDFTPNDTLNRIAAEHVSYLTSIPLNELDTVSEYFDGSNRDVTAMAAEAGYAGDVTMFVAITDSDITLDDLLFELNVQSSGALEDVLQRFTQTGLAFERDIVTQQLYYVLILGTSE